MLDFPVVLGENLPVVDRIQPQRNKFAIDVETIRLQVTQNSIQPWIWLADDSWGINANMYTYMYMYMYVV